MPVGQPMLALMNGPYLHLYVVSRMFTPMPTSSRCSSQEHVQLFHQSSLLKCKSLTSGVVASASPVSATVNILLFSRLPMMVFSDYEI